MLKLVSNGEHSILKNNKNPKNNSYVSSSLNKRQNNLCS